jgi:hypothetical protein
MSNIDPNIFCGFLEFEERENSGVFVRKFVRLNTSLCQLDYFQDNKDKIRESALPDGTFNVSFMSMAADASSSRPKIPHCFYIVVSGNKYYFKAYSDKEKLTWINRLQDASKINVPSRRSFIDESLQAGFKVEVVGGVVVKTPMEEPVDDNGCSDDGNTQHRSRSPLSAPSQNLEDEPPIKAGYCVKQGVFRKNWKNRYFTLTMSSLQYCRSLEDKTPIRIVKMSEILDARPSVGVHPTKENVFEVVTQSRVFYIQANSASDRESWISAIMKCLHTHNGPKNYS